MNDQQMKNLSRKIVQDATNCTMSTVSCPRYSLYRTGNLKKIKASSVEAAAVGAPAYINKYMT